MRPLGSIMKPEPRASIMRCRGCIGPKPRNGNGNGKGAPSTASLVFILVVIETTAGFTRVALMANRVAAKVGAGQEHQSQHRADNPPRQIARVAVLFPVCHQYDTLL